jgi:hypothetical protein
MLPQGYDALVKDRCHGTITGVLRLLAFIIVLSFLLTTHAHAQEFDIPAVTISGGDLPAPVTLAPADADAFRRRINLLPRLDDPPSVSGPRFTVTTGYWSDATRIEKDEDYQDVSMQGDYYPNGGYVRVSLDGEDIWQVLSLRQRAILDRYIHLTEGGLISQTPSTMDVLAAASKNEVFGVEFGDHVLDPASGDALLSAIAEANPTPLVDPREPPVDTGDGRWLVVTLVEGRALRYYYDATTLTEALGTERYDASSVADMLANLGRTAPPAIKQEKPAGSLLWWPVMLGGGMLAIGIAVWLIKTLDKTRPEA